jgi:hypothetical protein
MQAVVFERWLLCEQRAARSAVFVNSAHVNPQSRDLNQIQSASCNPFTTGKEVLCVKKHFVIRTTQILSVTKCRIFYSRVRGTYRYHWA